MVSFRIFLGFEFFGGFFRFLLGFEFFSDFFRFSGFFSGASTGEK
jgi:hypothetical protein